jgi:hypothetical protein
LSQTQRARPRRRRQPVERGVRLLPQRLGPLPGRRQPERRDIGRLALLGVLARGLAEFVRALRHVEHVVDDLERQSDRAAVDLERRCNRRIETTRAGAHPHRGGEQRAGLHPVHPLEFFERQRAADRGEVERLAAAHAQGRRGMRQFAHQRRARAIRQIRVGQHLERLGLQRVAGQHRGGLVERDVHGRLAAPHRVVIHAGQVVVNQRVHVHVLDRERRAVERGERRLGDLAGRVDQQRTHALAAAQHRVAHRLVQPLRRARLRRQLRVGGAFEARQPIAAPRAEVLLRGLGLRARVRRRLHRHWLPRSSSGFSGTSRSPSSFLISCSAAASLA